MYLGYKNPDTILKKSAVIFLDSHLDHPQNRKRVLLVGDEFKKSGVTIIHPNLDNIKSTFGVLLAQLLLGDYVSYYLALKNNEDPLEMERIENLKKKLI
jgi:glucose/mannose-6-phosphate isomerase